MSKFDDVILFFLGLIQLDEYYENHLWFQQFVKYGVSVTLVYWFGKAPLIWFMTEYLGLWYILSSFIVGVIITLIGFVIEKYFVFKKVSLEQEIDAH